MRTPHHAQAGLPVVHASKECSATGECGVTFVQEWLVMAGQETEEVGGGDRAGMNVVLLARRGCGTYL